MRRLTVALIAVWTLSGCSRSGGLPEVVWGEKGVTPGKLVKPRAVAIDKDDRVYIVDYSARIQAFDRDGHHLGPCFTSPDYRNGRPSGLSISNDNKLIVSDSHYHCVRIYEFDGTELRVLGGEVGSQPGQFGYISDCVQAPNGHFYLSEFGLNERISELDEAGHFVRVWGRKGIAEGEFNHIRALAIAPDGDLYVADACNHRIQVFDPQGNHLRSFGTHGDAAGQLSYPYDVAFGPGPVLYVVEYDNHRVQKFTLDGQSLGVWGGPGRQPGKLHNPWAIAVDHRGRVHVMDSENHRVQRISF